MDIGAFTIKTFVPRAQQAKHVFEVPQDMEMDVLTDQFPSVGAGDYIEVDTSTTPPTPVRAWPKADLEADYVEQTV